DAVELRRVHATATAAPEYGPTVVTAARAAGRADVVTAARPEGCLGCPALQPCDTAYGRIRAVRPDGDFRPGEELTDAPDALDTTEADLHLALFEGVDGKCLQQGARRVRYQASVDMQRWELRVVIVGRVDLDCRTVISEVDFMHPAQYGPAQRV